MANKLNMNKVKEQLSEVERFTRKHTTETLTAIAILVGAFSAWAHLFAGTLAWSIILMAIGAILGVFFPNQVDQCIKKIYSFSGEKKIGEMIAEIVKIAVALFLPFIYFGFLGLMAGVAYHYYAQGVSSGRKGK